MLGWIKWLIWHLRVWWWSRRIAKRYKRGLRFLDKVWRKHAGLG